MQFDAHCMKCLLNRQMDLVENYGTGEERFAYMKEAMATMVEAPKDVAAPYMVWKFNEIFAKYWGAVDHYAEIKVQSNNFMLQRLPMMREKIAQEDDPILMGLKFAQTGNYIDFGALAHDVSEEVLEEMLEKTSENEFDLVEYENFRNDLKSAKKLVYLGDNAGEIVADLALIEVLKKHFPQLQITFVVRGAAVLNDVTMEDAQAVGLDKLVPVMTNGTAIPGTEPSQIGLELQQTLKEADMVLSKGQGNFETFCPSPYNTYYIFLCKCQRFAKMFQVPKMTGMFLADRRMVEIDPYC